MGDVIASRISAERLAEIEREFTELGKDIERATHLEDGPGCVSAFYTSLSIADVLGLCASARASTPAGVVKERPEINNERVILKRLADGDSIAFSRDGEMAWFTKGGEFVGDVIISMREKGYLRRTGGDDDSGSYWGRDVISIAGRAALAESGQ